MFNRIKNAITKERLDKRLYRLNCCIKMIENGFDGDLERYIAERDMVLEMLEKCRLA